jgi:ribosomal protein S27E|tara:strand:+ start:1836 stop:2081 length:246 start_codon:yes stop_codon:yes gene_type:complete
MVFIHPDEDDVRLLENATFDTLESGCKECGYKQIVFQTCISIEHSSKVFFLVVECPKCKAEYKDIMLIKDVDDKYDRGNHK